MKIIRLLSISLVLGLTALAAPMAAGAQPTLALLPNAFAGWQISSTKSGSDPAAVDLAQNSALKEYGFTSYQIASYSQPGRKLTLRAARFQDATGAYGAFTFYRQPGMRNERIGAMAASDNDSVLFFRDNILVQATFDRLTAMSAAELRELAAALPPATGPAANLPTLPNYLPKDKIALNTAKFMVGPSGYSTLGLAIAENLIDFNRNPEVLTAKLTEPSTEAVLALIEYPTPQIAIEKTSSIANANAGPGMTLLVKRTGPIVKLVYGSIPQTDAEALLDQINYQAEVTWNENTGLSKRDNIGSLVIAALTLAGIIFLFSLGTGALLGFRRAIMARLFPRRYGNQKEETEFIRLNLGK